MAEHQNTQWVLWIYNVIMEQIEPDLLSDRIPTLPEKYKNESVQEKKTRMHAYAQAFKIFEEVFKEMTDGVYAEIEQLKKEAQQHRATEEQSEKRQQLLSIEEHFDSSSEADGI